MKRPNEDRPGFRWDAAKEKWVKETRGRKSIPTARRNAVPTSISKLELVEVEELAEKMGLRRADLMYSFFREGIARLKSGRADGAARAAPTVPLIFVAGPFTAETEYERHKNTQNAAAIALELWRAGAVVICPHLNSGVFFGAAPEELFCAGYFEIVRRSNAVLMLKGWEQSRHSLEEKIEAESNGIPVFLSTATVIKWLQGGAEPRRRKAVEARA